MTDRELMRRLHAFATDRTNPPEERRAAVQLHREAAERRRRAAARAIENGEHDA
jgi:hypothetical protein